MQRQVTIPRSVRHPFVLAEVLDGTQDYRWIPRPDGWLSGVLAGNLVHLRQSGPTLEYRANGDLDGLLHDYFRFDDDIDAIYSEISAQDACVDALAAQYPHVRLLRQPDPWECTVSYVCSANNNLRRISAIVERIAKRLGDPIELNGETRRAFPLPEVVLARAAILEGLSLGLSRPRKILGAAERVLDCRLDLEHLARPEVPYAEARSRLMECDGIGSKIAACLVRLGQDGGIPGGRAYSESRIQLPRVDGGPVPTRAD